MKAPPLFNLTPQERKSVTSLRKHQDITILPAGKRRCTVVLNIVDYHTKVTTVLYDPNTYESLSCHPTSRYKKAIECLQKLLKEETSNCFTDSTLVTPSLACMDFPRSTQRKLHLGPYKIAKYAVTIRAPLVGNTPHHINFVNKVQTLKLCTDETIVSYDATSLVTCIPTIEAVEMVVQITTGQHSTHQDQPQPGPDLQIIGPHWCLNTTYFKYNGEFYRLDQSLACESNDPQLNEWKNLCFHCSLPVDELMKLKNVKYTCFALFTCFCICHIVLS